MSNPITWDPKSTPILAIFTLWQTNRSGCWHTWYKSKQLCKGPIFSFLLAKKHNFKHEPSTQSVSTQQLESKSSISIYQARSLMAIFIISGAPHSSSFFCNRITQSSPPNSLSFCNASPLSLALSFSFCSFSHYHRSNGLQLERDSRLAQRNAF